MPRIIAQLISAAIPMVFGITILMFPQVMTKKNLKDPENKPALEKLLLFGWVFILLGVVMILFEIVKALIAT